MREDEIGAQTNLRVNPSSGAVLQGERVQSGVYELLPFDSYLHEPAKQVLQRQVHVAALYLVNDRHSVGDFAKARGNFFLRDRL